MYSRYDINVYIFFSGLPLQSQRSLPNPVLTQKESFRYYLFFSYYADIFQEIIILLTIYAQLRYFNYDILYQEKNVFSFVFDLKNLI